MKKDGYDEPYQDAEEETDILNEARDLFYFSTVFRTVNRLTGLEGVGNKTPKRIFSRSMMIYHSKQTLFDSAKRTLNTKVHTFNYYRNYRSYCDVVSLFAIGAHEATVIDKARDDWFY